MEHGQTVPLRAVTVSANRGQPLISLLLQVQLWAVR